jgi:murein DD-endopeptidase MepM/ murein hydrolase activator NlpD
VIRMERFRLQAARSLFSQRKDGMTHRHPPLSLSLLIRATAKGIGAWVERTFPERQIYVRSDGRVKFFTFGPALQALLAAAALVLLCWFAFASVNVFFRDRALVAKDRHYHQMQASYQQRLADLTNSYDGLNGALAGAEGKFKAAADKLETKQAAIANLLSRKAEVEAAIAPDLNRPVAIHKSADAVSMDETQSVAVSAAIAPLTGGDEEDGGTLSVLPEPVAAQPRASRPDHAGLLNDAWAKLRRMAAFVLPSPNASAFAKAYAQNPRASELRHQIARLTALEDGDTRLMDQSRVMLAGDITRLRDLVRKTGINANQLQRRLTPGEGMGGPEIPLNQAELDGLDDTQFNAAYLQASAILNQLEGLTLELKHLPLSLPVDSDQVDLSSGFGARLDPFTRHYAFHPGMDFAGPWGTLVHATAAGTVIFAGGRGSYGNMVEIDHGMGLHTRYGHLSAVSVRVGMRVEKGAAIGRLGSTGRSTGPHVHYEVWYDDKVRNPANFIEAGRHVF